MIQNAQQNAQELNLAKDPSIYVLYLANAIKEELRSDLDAKYSESGLPETAYKLYQLLSEAAEQALLERIFEHVLCKKDKENFITYNELTPDESVAGAANVASKVRLAAIEAENIKLLLQSGKFSSNVSLFSELKKLSDDIVQSSNIASDFVREAQKEGLTYKPNDVDARIANELTIFYRNEKQKEHTEGKNSFRGIGDPEDPKKIKMRNPIQNHYDSAVNAQIKARLSANRLLGVTTDFDKKIAIWKNNLKAIREASFPTFVSIISDKQNNHVSSEEEFVVIEKPSQISWSQKSFYIDAVDCAYGELEAALHNDHRDNQIRSIRIVLATSIAGSLFKITNETWRRIVDEEKQHRGIF
ncbi:MAG: hypothetical protein FJ390_06125 [Verrucomicrobia bacterium]|nr:hypothetical protein [Verrucomicrobiota bacterium]